MRSHALVFPAVLACLGACTGGKKAPAPEPAAVSTTAEFAIADSMVPIARVAGSTFIEILEVRVIGDKLIYCTGVRGLQVVDARDPRAMKVTHELRSRYSHERFARCQHLAVDGDRVFFTNRGDMIQKKPFITGFNLATSPPEEIFNYAPEGMTIEGIAVRGSKLFVASHERGLVVLETAGGKGAVLGSAEEFKAAWSVDVAGNFAYVADATGRLGIIDVRNPSRLLVRANMELGGSAQSVVVRGNLAYVAAGASGLIIVDVKDPAAPKVVSETRTSGSALQVSVDGDRAFVANWGDARIYDISDPSTPHLIAAEVVKTEEGSSRVLGMSGRGDVAFVGEWTGMHAYRLFDRRRAPHATVNKAMLSFGRTPAGTEKRLNVALSNEGSAALTIASAAIVSVGSGFELETPPQKTIEPGGFASLSVVFKPEAGSPKGAELVISTNDPDEPELRVVLAGNQEGLAVGDKFPELELALVDGGRWRLSEQRGKVVLLAYFATF